MNKASWLVLILLFVLSLQASPALADQKIIQSTEQFGFAQKLMDSEEYDRAVGEFERFIHFFPDDEKVPEARYLIGVSYLKARRYEAAREASERVYKDYPNRPISGKALFLIGESYFRQGISKEADRYFNRVLLEYPQPELKNAALYRLGWTRLQENEWRKASEIFRTVEKSSPLYPSAMDLSEESLKGEDLPYKNPTAAGVMAAVVPGLGHVYSNRYKDGMVAFLLNGVFILATLEAFDKDLEVVGGMLLFLEVGWYTGNIYSAVNTAHKHNRKIRNDFRRSLPDKLNLHFFMTRAGDSGLALSFDF